jgi:hypothetical protein
MNDTVILYELGLVSEIDKSLGEEIKYRWRYTHSSDKLILTGYVTGDEGTIRDTGSEIVYKVVR